MRTNNLELRTSYFSDSWTWTKRVLIIMVFVILLLGWEFSGPSTNYWWIKYVLFVALSLGVFVSPVDDLAVDDKYFYHLRTSLLRALSHVDKYEIENIKTIRCLGVHVPGLSLLEGGTRRYQGGHTNTIEMSFKDNFYKSLEVAVYKKELVYFISKIRERMTIDGQ